MRLEMADFPVKQVVLGRQTRYDNGTLELNGSELKGLVLQDPRVSSVDIELVAPGEDARIAMVMDAITPRIKVEGQGVVFPGVVGPIDAVGSGKDHQLGNVAVVCSCDTPAADYGTFRPRPAFIDMSGVGARTGISQCHVVAILPELAPGYTASDYREAIRLSIMRVGKRLAEATVGQKPAQTEVFDNTPNDSLPPVVFVQGFLAVRGLSTTYYGETFGDAFAKYVHPSEFWDGAVLATSLGSAGMVPISWHFMNHPIIKGLYRAHGKTLNFVGAILQPIGIQTFEGKILSGQQTAKLAQALGAQGAILTWMVAGNAFIDLMQATKACEQLGIKTVMLTYEMGGVDGREPPLLFQVPEAVAIVTTGVFERDIRVPKVKRVVGPAKMPFDAAPNQPYEPTGEAHTFVTGNGPVIGAVDIWGSLKDTCLEF